MSTDYSKLTSHGAVDGRPWYRYGWPWFLMSFPAISIVLGAIMLILSLQANNSLVVDDYYKQGKAINLRIERDRVASLLGVSAAVSPSDDAISIQLALTQPSNLPAGLGSEAQALQSYFTLPASLQIQWIHVTQARHDGSAEAQHAGGGRYVVPDVHLPAQGKYRLHLQPTAAQNSDSNWRLVSGLQSFSTGQVLRVDAPLINQVYSAAQLE